MENSYGIGVTNRYALFLNDEEDPLEILKAQEQEKEARRKTKLSEKENANNKTKPVAKGKQAPVVRKGIKDSQSVKTVEITKPKEAEGGNKTKLTRTPSDRNVKFVGGETREERNNRRNREDRPPPPAEFREPTRFESGDAQRARGRGTGRGAGRGRGRGRGGYDIRGKREFDRQSGSDKSGVKPVDKREGGGAHNWGNYKDDIDEQMNTSNLSNENTDWAEKSEGEVAPPEPTEVKVTESSGEEAEVAAPTEEGPRELTLDEWKAMRGNRQKPTFNIRKAGEGEDPTQWKKMYALKKKEGEEEDEEDEVNFEYDAAEYPQRVGRQKHVLDIDIHFADSRRGARGRGRGVRGAGRGGPRGTPRAGGRGGGQVNSTSMVLHAPKPGVQSLNIRTSAQRAAQLSHEEARGARQSAPKVDDENDFPSLG